MLRDRYAIVGVGQSALGQVPGSNALDLLVDAMVEAVADAGLEKGDVDAVVCRGPDDVYTHHQRVAQLLGIDAGFSTTLDNGGASQILSIAVGLMAIDAGLCNTVVCGFGRDGWSRTHRTEEDRIGQRTTRVGGADSTDDGYAGPAFGLFGAPAMHAFGARRHMARYGTTKEQLGAVAVAFRGHAQRNPSAQMNGRPLDLDGYLAGRPIVDPFNVFDCSLRTDGAGAVVVTSAERARDLRHTPVLVGGFGTFNNCRGWFFDDHMLTTAAKPSGEKAFAMAGLGPQEVDLFQVYDCFTSMVVAQLEDYGFCAKGDGGGYAASGALELSGSLPTNTSGGQLSEGHVEGMLQIVEAVRQLRHEYGPDRQVAGAEVALVSGHGGNTVCHSSLVLRRP